MEIILAKSAGFCFGVRRAVDEVYRQAELCGEKSIFTFGPIIHNEEVVSDLKKRGVLIIHSEEELDLANHAVVIIRSHGVSRRVEEEIRKKEICLIDMTCPFVKKIHHTVEEQSRLGKKILIAGNAGHPEVQGIMGWCEGEVRTIESPEELEELPAEWKENTCLVSQTTFSKEKFKIILDLIRKKGYTINVADTICNATACRQEEAAKIASAVDTMLVIGSRNSSNTQKLYEICKKECNRTHYIQTAEDLNQQWFLAAEKVGVTAGASTPNNIIEEVLNNVRGFWTVIK